VIDSASCCVTALELCSEHVAWDDISFYAGMNSSMFSTCFQSMTCVPPCDHNYYCQPCCNSFNVTLDVCLAFKHSGLCNDLLYGTCCHDSFLVHIAHHTQPSACQRCTIPGLSAAKFATSGQHQGTYCAGRGGEEVIDYINLYLRIQLSSTFGLEQGGSCKKSAWIEDHAYAGTADFFITRCCSANCMRLGAAHHQVSVSC